MTIIHTELANGRWQALSLVEQLGNVGSEVSRALSARASGNKKRENGALDRMLELMDFTINDPKNRHGLQELCRVREVLCDFFFGDNEYSSTPESLDTYFYAYGLAARRKTNIPASANSQ